MASRKVKKTVMAKRNLFTVKIARALRTMFGYSNDKAPSARPQPRERRAVPQIYTRDYRHTLTLAQPIVRDDQGYYIAHDEQGGVWRAVSGDIRHGWEAVPFDERPPLVQIRDYIPAEDGEERPIRAAARRAARRTRVPRRADDAADIFDEEGEALEYVPVGEELGELTSAFSRYCTYSVPEIMARGATILQFKSRDNGSVYAILTDGTTVDITPESDSGMAPVQQPIRPADIQRWLYLPEPHRPSNDIINATEIQWTIFSSLERFLENPECNPIRALLSGEQKAAILEKTHKWVKYLVRKVLAQKRDLLYTVSPFYNVQTKQILSLHMTCQPISKVGYQTHPSTETLELHSTTYLSGSPWLQDLDVYIQATRRPVFMALKPNSQVYRDRLTFAFVDKDGDRIFYGEEPELAHFVHPLYKFDPDSEIIRDIVASFLGFVLDPTITRNWAEYDIAKFGPESMIKIREFMLSHWMEETRKLKGYEQFYIGDHKGHPYVLVPLKSSEYTNLEGKAMRHCVGGYEPNAYTRYYSIREARRVNGELVPVRSRITFDVSCDISSDHAEFQVLSEKTQGSPLAVAPPIAVKWNVGSIKGIRNMNNPEWKRLVTEAGVLIGIPQLGDYYESNER